MSTSNDSNPKQLELPFTITIELTRGYSTVIDDADSDLAGLKWFTRVSKNTCYAARNKSVDGHRTTIFVHQVILSRILGRDLIKGEMVDHEDGNGLNNQRSNLRLATGVENSRNRRIRRDNVSGFKGVCWHKATARWVSQIQVNGKKRHLGLYATPEEAYAVYCEAAAELFGEFARFE